MSSLEGLGNYTGLSLPIAPFCDGAGSADCTQESDEDKKPFTATAIESVSKQVLSPAELETTAALVDTALEGTQDYFVRRGDSQPVLNGIQNVPSVLALPPDVPIRSNLNFDALKPRPS